MKFSRVRCEQATLTFSFILLAFPPAGAQGNSVQPRVTQAIDDQVRVTLKGNTHPLARPEFDIGAAPDDQPMRRMLLLLKRSPEQEAALRQLLDEQQTKSSPNYHQWLTPEGFGERFGPADSDVQAVTDWLRSMGFEVTRVSAGRRVIEFSGTAGAVRDALHTEIHRFRVNGEEHWANASDPEIPAALAPVVAGIVSLNNFPRKPFVQVLGEFSRSKKTGEVEPLATVTASNGTTFYAVGPTDFATIYNVLPLWNASPAIDGTGVKIAIVAETDINTSDMQNFRNMWGLPAVDLETVRDGPDPGVVDAAEEGEADVDTQWSSAVAKGAIIDMVISETTETTAGVDLSALYIIDNNLAPVMSMSFGECESQLLAAGNGFYNSLWEQGSAEGITIIVAAGDSGSDVCDFGLSPWATHGLSVSGTASTPFNVAVGGTDFNDAGTQSTYWNATNAPTTFASAKSYIPESTWNLSCAASGLSGCPSPSNTGIDLEGGSGGPSSVYTKPAWQSGAGVPADSARDLPDVAMFASVASSSKSFYAYCQGDRLQGMACSQNAFLGAGGTSISAPVFAGIMALVVQKTGQRQGNANYVLYPLAAESGASCASNVAAVSSTSCVFYDTVTGNNSVACKGGTPNCSNTTTTGYGVLVDPNSLTTPAWTTTAGYDRATGLGSVNAANLVSQWSSVSFHSTTTTLSLSATPATSPITLRHGQPANFNINVTSPSGTPTGAVSLIGGPGARNLGLAFATLGGGSASGTTVFLPGGSYGVTAHYAGDGTFGASDSTPPVQVTVNPESSLTKVGLITFDPMTGNITSTNATNVTYGEPDILRVDVTNASGNLCAPQGALLIYGCPTGAVQLIDNGVALDLGTYNLNSQGYAEDQPIQLPPGSHSIVASYGGDRSYSSSTSSADAITVTQAATTIALTAPASVGAGDSLTLSAIVNTRSTGAGPSGTVQFLNGSAALGTASCAGIPFSPSTGKAAFCSATLTTSLTATATITAQYGGDGNYLASTSTPATVSVTPEFGLAASPTSVTIASPGGSATTTLTVTAAGGFSGTVTFLCSVPFAMTGGACTLNPASVATSGNTTLSVTTTAGTSALPRTGPSKRPGWFVMLWTAGLTFLLLILRAKKRRPRLAFSLLALVLLSAVHVACGGGGSGGGPTHVPGTPAGSYNVSVTGTSVTLSHTVIVTVAVQ